MSQGFCSIRLAGRLIKQVGRGRLFVSVTRARSASLAVGCCDVARVPFPGQSFFVWPPDVFEWLLSWSVECCGGVGEFVLAIMVTLVLV